MMIISKMYKTCQLPDATIPPPISNQEASRQQFHWGLYLHEKHTKQKPRCNRLSSSLHSPKAYPVKNNFISTLLSNIQVPCHGTCITLARSWWEICTLVREMKMKQGWNSSSKIAVNSRARWIRVKTDLVPWLPKKHKLHAIKTCTNLFITTLPKASPSPDSPHLWREEELHFDHDLTCCLEKQSSANCIGHLSQLCISRP